MSTAEKNRLPDSKFAFPEQRKEPLVDAKHVRNAVARFDQVEGVRTPNAIAPGAGSGPHARRFDVEITERGWRQLFEGGKAKKR